MADEKNLQESSLQLQALFNEKRSSELASRIRQWVMRNKCQESQRIFCQQVNLFRKTATRSSCLWLLETITFAVSSLKSCLKNEDEWKVELGKTGSWAWKGLREDEKGIGLHLMQDWIGLQLATEEDIKKWTSSKPKRTSCSGKASEPASKKTKSELPNENIPYSPAMGCPLIAKSQHMSVVVTPSPPSIRQVLNPDTLVYDGRWGGGGVREEVRVADVSFRMVKIDGCALIRHVGKAMGYGERAMLSSFHFFHHFQWISPDVDMVWPPSDLPAVCLACLHLAGKAEDTAYRVEYLLDIINQLRMTLPPYRIGSKSKNYSEGQLPSLEDILHYEFQILETLNFNTTLQHPSRILPSVMEQARVPPALRDVVTGFFQTRVYTDSDVCLQENRVAVIGAAMVYMNLAQKECDVQWKLPENFVEMLQVPWVMVADFLAQFVRTAKDLRTRLPSQTLLKVALLPRRYSTAKTKSG